METPTLAREHTATPSIAEQPAKRQTRRSAKRPAESPAELPAKRPAELPAERPAKRPALGPSEDIISLTQRLAERMAQHIAAHLVAHPNEYSNTSPAEFLNSAQFMAALPTAPTTTEHPHPAIEHPVERLTEQPTEHPAEQTPAPATRPTAPTARPTAPIARLTAPTAPAIEHPRSTSITRPLENLSSSSTFMEPSASSEPSAPTNLSPAAMATMAESLASTAAGKRLAAMDRVRRVYLREGKEINWKRAGNIEAVLAFTRGIIAEEQCKSCGREKGPFEECIVVEGMLKGSCAGCHYGSDGKRCSFREGDNRRGSGTAIRKQFSRDRNRTRALIGCLRTWMEDGIQKLDELLEEEE